MNFYAVIIGTEILNNRREDKHFEFIKKELLKYGHELFASFIIKDDTKLIKKIFSMIKSDPKAVMFSFGGIGSTPDDLTREIASDVFRDATVTPHKQFLKDIIDRFNDEAYPHRVHMANLPPKSKLLFNPVNNMSGFSLDEKYFFTPGFPSMSHPMICTIIKELFFESNEKFRLTLIAQTSEEKLISVMRKLPKEIELSCLPMFVKSKAVVELSIKGENKNKVYQCFNLFKHELDKNKTEYKII